MPKLSIDTNVSLEGLDISDILKDLSQAISQILGKPEQYVMVSINGGVPICYAGSQDPAAYGELVSIGGLDPDTNKALSASIALALQSKLCIPKSRFYIKFYNAKGANFGWRGSTF